MAIKTDLKSFTKRLVIREKFWNTDFVDDSLVRNESSKNFQTSNRELNTIVENIENLNPINVEKPDNITMQERGALKEFKENKDIIVKKGNKGGNFVIMDKDFSNK